jgi:hypothetical protein
MNTCSCLNLILACIVYWQACEISRVLSECAPVANVIDLSLLGHVSPIEPTPMVQSFFKHKNEFYRVKKRDLFLKPFRGVFFDG